MANTNYDLENAEEPAQVPTGATPVPNNQVQPLDPCCKLWLSWKRNPQGMSWPEYAENHGMSHCPVKADAYQTCARFERNVG